MIATHARNGGNVERVLEMTIHKLHHHEGVHTHHRHHEGAYSYSRHHEIATAIVVIQKDGLSHLLL